MTPKEKFTELDNLRIGFLESIKSRMYNANSIANDRYFEFQYLGYDLMIICEINPYQNSMIMKTYQISDKDMIFGERKFEFLEKLNVTIDYHTGQEDYYAAVMREFKPLHNKLSDRERFAQEYEKSLDSVLKEKYSV